MTAINDELLKKGYVHCVPACGHAHPPGACLHDPAACDNLHKLKKTRTLWKWIAKNNGYGQSIIEAAPETEDPELISSETQDGYHLPVIDCDFEIEAVPSSTPGHFHLYINETITWDQYKRLLLGFMEAGLIQKGWYDQALKDGRSYVRRKGVFKPFDELKQKIEESGDLFPDD